MAMLLRIAKQDLRLLRRERAVFLMAALLVALTGFGVYNGAKLRNAQGRAVEDVQRETEEAFSATKRTIAEAQARLLPVTVESATSPSSYDVKPFWSLRYVMGIRGVSPPTAAYPVAAEVPGIGAPPSTLAVLSVGQSELRPVTTGKIGFLHFKPTFFNSHEHDNPLNLLAGTFDLAFVCIYLFPLIIIALAYNLLSQEREQGTLTLALAQPIHLRQLAFGKALARLSVVLVFGLGAALVWVLASGVDFREEGAFLRLGLWTMSISLYIIFWFAVAVAVNARGYSSAMNAAALIGVWLFTVVLAPTLLNLAVSLFAPLPSRAAYLSESRAAAREYAQQENAALNKNRAVPREPTLPKAEAVIEMHNNLYLAQRSWRAQTAQINARYQEHKVRQQAFINRAQFISPAIALENIVNELAGTQPTRHERFTRQAAEYLDVWQAALLAKVRAGDLLHPTDYDQLPRFSFREEPAGEIARRVLPGMLMLFFTTLLFAGTAFRVLRHYPLAA